MCTVACYRYNKKPCSSNQVVDKLTKNNWSPIRKPAFVAGRRRWDRCCCTIEEKKNPKDTNYRKQYDKPTRDTRTRVTRPLRQQTYMADHCTSSTQWWLNGPRCVGGCCDRQADQRRRRRKVKPRRAAVTPPLLFLPDDKLTAPRPASFKMYRNRFCVMCPDQFDKILYPTHIPEKVLVKIKYSNKHE